MGIPKLYKVLNALSNKIGDRKEKFVFDEFTNQDIIDNPRYINSQIINNTQLLYIDFQSIIFNVINKFSGIINDYVYELVYQSDVAIVNKYYTDNSSILEEFTSLNSDGTVNIISTIDNIKFLKTDVNRHKTFMINKVINETKLIINLFNLKNLQEVNIFFEGIPNVSKMKEQVLRRIDRTINKMIDDELNVKLLDPANSKENTTYRDTMFELNLIISPKENWMEELFTSLGDNLRRTYLGKTIYLSPTSDPGEAEHKILQEIKRRRKEIIDKEIMFYSPDGDVIILTTYLRNIGIKCNLIKSGSQPYRDTNYIYKYSIVDTKKLINYLWSKITDKSKNQNNVIMDILFLFNMFGDDFIPKIDSIKLDHKIGRFRDEVYDEFEMIFKNYNKINRNYILRFESGIYKINSANLIDYISFFTTPVAVTPTPVAVTPTPVKSTEEIRFNSHIKSPFSTDITLDSKNFIMPNNINVLKYNNINKNSREINNPSQRDRLNIIYIKILFNLGYILNLSEDLNYKTLYYNENRNVYNLSDPSMNSENVLSNQEFMKSVSDNIIQKYLEGVQYVLDLYFNNGVENKFWYYNYDYAPTLTSIVEFANRTPRPNIDIIFNNYKNYPKNTKYFTMEEYKNYINKIKTEYFTTNIENLNYVNIKNIFNTISCKNSPYINKCHLRINMEDPIQYLKNNRCTFSICQQNHKFIDKKMYFVFENIRVGEYKLSIVEDHNTAICTRSGNICLEIDNISDDNYPVLFRNLNYNKIYREDGLTLCTKDDLKIINCDVFKGNLKISKKNNWNQKYLKNTEGIVSHSSYTYQSKYLKYKQKYLALKKLLNKN